jgi:2-C-methyl-D-erythritol 4-phosphate cytidylyltransferase
MKRKQSSYCAIILAGGSGERMGGKLKQFLKVNNKPLFSYSLEVFIQCDFIKRIILIVPRNKLIYVRKNIKINFFEKKIELVAGGETRKKSTFNALKFISQQKNKYDYVIIHDAARPLISLESVESVSRAANYYGNATVGITAIDLIFEARNKFVRKAINKEKIYYGFTPQCLNFKTLWKAHKISRKNKSLEHADNIELMKKYSPQAKIKIIDEFYPNIKLTYLEDKPIIEYILKNKYMKN